MWTEKLKNTESPKSCEAKTINRYHENKMAYTHFETLCVKNSGRKNERRLTGGTMLVDEIRSEKVQK